MRSSLPFALVLALPTVYACGDKDDGGDSAGGGGEGTGAEDDTGTDADDTGDAPPTGPVDVTLPTTGLGPQHLAIVVNTDDPLSAEIASAYADARGIDDTRIIALSLGTSAQLDETSFEEAKAVLDASLDDEVQALLLTFTTPYQVSCMGASAAFALGFDEGYCSDPCAATTPVDYYDSPSTLPYTDHGIRPAMMLSAETLEEAEAIIERGVAADDTRPLGDGWMIRTTDSARSVRYGSMEDIVDYFYEDELVLEYVDNSDGSGSDVLTGEQDVLFYLTGLTSVSDIDTNTFLPGALADHLTSYGGVLSDANSQMPITEWLKGGATASYGTAHEPCNYTQKFPEPEVLIPQYFRGATAIEAYWKSVNWPGEGNFVGEPLARPFSQSWTWEDGVLTIETTHLDLRSDWQLEAADDPEGPWELVEDEIGPGRYYRRLSLEFEDTWRPYYRLVETG